MQNQGQQNTAYNQHQYTQQGGYPPQGNYAQQGQYNPTQYPYQTGGRRGSMWPVVIIILLLAVIAVAVVCYITHENNHIICSPDKLCLLCKMESGDHTWSDAGCEEYSVCKLCDAQADAPVEHQWKEATDLTPKTCLSCGERVGRSLGVLLTECEIANWTEAKPNAPVDIKVGPWQAVSGTWYEDALRFWVRSGAGYSENEEVTYYLDDEFDILAGVIALGADTEYGGGARISIYGDGELLYQSAYLTKDMRAEEIELDIKGVETVTVRCEAAKPITSFGILSAKLYVE